MNILITGGAGFIGSHFVKKLAKERPDWNLIVLDKLTYAGNKKNLEGVKHRFLEMDIADEEIHDVFSTFGINWVINFAAETHVDRSIRYPKAFLETDIMGIFNLVKASIERKVSKFVHISTDEVYGPILEGEASESYPLNPTSPYSASKAAAELLLRSYQKTYGLPLIIFRPCNCFGPGQYPEKLIPITITRILKGQRAIVHGNGHEWREWMYVDDMVDIMYRLILSVECVGLTNVLNIGSGFRLKNVSVIESIFQSLSVKPDIEYVNNRPGNDYRYAISSENLRSILWRYPEESFEKFREHLAETISWYKENQDWWKDIDISSNIYKSGEGYVR